MAIRLQLQFKSVQIVGFALNFVAVKRAIQDGYIDTASCMGQAEFIDDKRITALLEMAQLL
ncbi:hypothetical protein O4G74_13975 [Henriciella marina]|uniref:EAL domain-containing protein n=1 Tax=Henriciella marina TaxID=453851 RepID=A0ABT4LXQ9_9PROT|nr:hypothetical protein [Henriciella marina]MCZ4299169.1 hypothetical protein [Henriciella marina]